MPPVTQSEASVESDAATTSDYLTVVILLVCWAALAAEFHYRLHLTAVPSLYKSFCCVVVAAFCLGGLWFSKAIFTRVVYILVLSVTAYGLSLWII